LADRRIESADPETRRIAAKYLESNYLPRTASLSDRVEELTRRLLPTGQCSVDAIADQLAMHPRSLQRGLATEGVGCQDLIERERRARLLSTRNSHIESSLASRLPANAARSAYRTHSLS
jgi:AraC-like DNA-binding protein